MMQTIKTTVRLTAAGRRVTATASGAAGRVSYVFPEDDTPGHDYMDQHAAAARALLVRLGWRGVYVAGALDTRGGVVWVNRDGVTVDGKPEPRDMSELVERVTDAGSHFFRAGRDALFSVADCVRVVPLWRAVPVRDF